MACGAESSSSAKRQKVDEAKEEEDPLVRRRNELILGVENARAKAKELEERLVREAEEEAERLKREAAAEGERMVSEAKERAILESGRNISQARLSMAQHLPSVCAELEAKNRKLLGRLPPDLWRKILDENLHQNDLLALAMTCRFFRDTTKDLGMKLEMNLNPWRLLNLRESEKMASPSLGWFRWVCDTFEILTGYKWGSMTVEGAMYEDALVNYAAFQGNVEILRWLMEGYEFDEGACSGAALGGHLKALKFLRGLGPPCPWDELTCSWAAYGGHLEVLKWARDQDPPCPWDAGTCSYAAEEGHLEVLKWARAQEPPCPWDAGTCSYAARYGKLDVLKWLRSQDPPCPWDEDTCSRAARGGHLDVLKWARSQDPPCPWRRGECRADASKYGHQHVVDWIDQQED